MVFRVRPWMHLDTHRQIIHPTHIVHYLQYCGAVGFFSLFFLVRECHNSMRCDKRYCNISNVNIFKSWFTRCYQYIFFICNAETEPYLSRMLLHCNSNFFVVVSLLVLLFAEVGWFQYISIAFVCYVLHAWQSTRSQWIRNKRIAENVKIWSINVAKWHKKRRHIFAYECVVALFRVK